MRFQLSTNLDLPLVQIQIDPCTELFLNGMPIRKIKSQDLPKIIIVIVNQPNVVGSIPMFCSTCDNHFLVALSSFRITEKVLSFN